VSEERKPVEVKIVGESGGDRGGGGGGPTTVILQLKEREFARAVINSVNEKLTLRIP